MGIGSVCDPRGVGATCAVDNEKVPTVTYLGVDFFVRNLSGCEHFFIRIEVTTVPILFDVCQFSFGGQKRYNDVVRFVIIE